MNKGRFIKTVTTTLCLTSMMSIAVFAQVLETHVGTYAMASLEQSYSGNLRKGTAITRPNDLYKKDDGTEASDYQTLTYIKAYYDDGDTGEKLEGPYYCSTKVEYDYGYIESFRSAHKVFKYSMLLGQVELP